MRRTILARYFFYHCDSVQAYSDSMDHAIFFVCIFIAGAKEGGSAGCKIAHQVFENFQKLLKEENNFENLTKFTE